MDILGIQFIQRVLETWRLRPIRQIRAQFIIHI